MAGLDFLDVHPFVRATAIDKARGTIIGSALGDCIGLYTEFLPHEEAQRVYPDSKFKLGITEFREDGHRNKFEPGSWTDDTDHALLLILAYLHDRSWTLPRNQEEFNLDFSSRLQNWCSQGLRCLETPPLGLGMTVGRIARDPEFPATPKDISLKVWVDASPNVKPAANGSLMRTHPLGILCISLNLEETFEVAASLGELTHIDLRCTLSCVVVTGLLRGILRGEILNENDLDVLLDKAETWVKQRPRDEKMQATPDELLHKDELETYLHATTYEQLELDDRKTMGYVYKSLGSSLLALRKAMASDRGFEDLITELIMQGGDADTNACTAGALLGCWFGASRLPEQWVQGMRDREWLHRKVKDLMIRVGLEAGELREDPDTALDGGKGFLDQKQLDKMESDMVFKVLEKSRLSKEARVKKEKASKKNWLGF